MLWDMVILELIYRIIYNLKRNYFLNLRFEDNNIKKDDKFEVKITIDDLTIFARKLQGIAYNVAKTQKKESERL